MQISSIVLKMKPVMLQVSSVSSPGWLQHVMVSLVPDLCQPEQAVHLDIVGIQYHKKIA
jgi:hypothetical protein